MKPQATDVLLSACMIVKDEEKYLKGCLASLENIADEIVVVDTGSTDRTKDIAEEFGARLYEFPWNDDFSAARNAALERARGKWILTVDADERIRALPRAYIERLTADSSKVAYYVLHYYVKGWTALLAMRLFRNDPRIRYTGIMHENVYAGIDKVISTEGLEVGRSSLVIDHLGYEDDLGEKYRRYLPLLLKELERAPGNSTNWRHLAVTYYGMGETGLAEEAWNKAIDSVRKRAEFLPVDAGSYIDRIQLDLVEGRDVGSILEDAMNSFPDNPSLYWLKGKFLMRKARYLEAIPLFEKLLLWGRKRDFDRSICHNVKIFDEYAYDSLGTCYFRLKRFKDARDNYLSALEYAPEKLEYKIKGDLCSKLADQKAAEPGVGVSHD